MAVLDFLICVPSPEEGRALTEILDGEAYRSEIVTDSGTAVDRLLTSGVRALIIDADIHVGLDVTEAVPIMKKIDPRLPVIVVSADSRLDRERAIRALGIFYYLVRPIEREELVRVAQDALRRQPVGMGH